MSIVPFCKYSCSLPLKIALSTFVSVNLSICAYFPDLLTAYSVFHRFQFIITLSILHTSQTHLSVQYVVIVCLFHGCITRVVVSSLICSRWWRVWLLELWRCCTMPVPPSPPLLLPVTTHSILLPLQGSFTQSASLERRSWKQNVILSGNNLGIIE